MNTNKPKVVIVGAGISGLTAGIYCLDNGFDVEIYEKHYIPGGECTGWTRKGQYIDGCAHWIVGTEPSSELYPLWEHIGIFEGNPTVFPTEYLTKFQISDGRFFTFWSDIDKLKEEFHTFFPEDKKAINGFIRTIKAYQHTHIPVRKPLDHMNPLEITMFGMSLLPMVLPFVKYKHVSVVEYAKRFKNPDLRGIFQRFVEPEYNIHSFMYVCQTFTKGDAGIVEGGSLPMVMRIVEKFKRLGGKLFLNKPVKQVNIEKNVANGITLEDGTTINADYVIASSDIHHTLYGLLDGKYHDKDFERQFRDKAANPVRSSVMLAYRTTRNMTDYPRMMDFLCEPFDWHGQHHDHYAIRNFTFDKSLPSKDGETLLTVLLPSNEDVYNYLKSLPREEYLKEKQAFADKFTQMMLKDLGLKKDELELIDITTPLTYERYTNAYQGAYMSFVTTKDTKGLMRPGLIKGLKNFVIAGQWIMPPGGLPVALFSGKHAAIRVCKMAKVKFVNKEEQTSSMLKELSIN
ncbi:MAG: NAD(P)/FAD-dependent oxidoreductase [Bacilli bacterium]|nr:NAD(P)/FAD-dependent oxidoreductase [Bacilli bacterium]